MTTWVKLKNQQGQHWDSRINWGIKLDEIKELPDDIPAGSITAERLRMGGLVKCDPPTARDQNMFPAPETVQVPVDKSAESLISKKIEAEQPLEPPEPPPKKTTKKKASTKKSTSRWGKK
jgi:hypothetical protein